MSRFLKKAPLAPLILMPMLIGVAPGVVAPAGAQDTPKPEVPPARGSTLPVPGEAPAAPATGAETPGAPVPTVPALPEPEIDATAKEILKQASDAYKALTSLSENIEVVVTPPVGNVETAKISVAYQKPGKALVRRTEAEGQSVAAADGATIYMTRPQVKGEYLKRVLPAEANPVDIVLASTSGAGPGLDMWISGENILESLMPILTGLKVSEGSKIGDTDVSTVVMALKSRRGPATLTFSFSNTDRLLRRVQMEQTLKAPDGSDKKLLVIETHSNVLANTALTPALLKFTPPTGSKPVTELVPPSHDARLKVGVVPFPINAKDLNGKTLSLSQYAGKVTLLDFWATWCDPCMQDMPNVIAAYNKFKPQGFDIIGISLDESKDDLQQVIKLGKIPWRQIYDGKNFLGTVPKSYGVGIIPTNILIGRDGKIAAINIHGPNLEKAVRTALTKKLGAQKPGAKTAAKPKTAAKAKSR